MNYYVHSANKMINLIREEAQMRSLFFLKNHFDFGIYSGIMRDDISVLSHTRLKETELVFVAKKKSKINDQ